MNNNGILDHQIEHCYFHSFAEQQTLGFLTARDHGHLPDANDVVGVSGKQGLSVRGPGHGEALGWVRASIARDFRAEFFDHVLALKVPNFDGGAGGGAQPVPAKIKIYKLNFSNPRLGTAVNAGGIRWQSFQTQQKWGANLNIYSQRLVKTNFTQDNPGSTLK